MGIFGKSGSKKKLPKTVQDTIPYQYIYKNGVISTAEDTFTKMYEFEDINFQMAAVDEQENMFRAYGSFLNSFPADVSFQVLIYNRPTDRRAFLNEVRFSPEKDGLNKYRMEMNEMISERIVRGKNNLSQNKYLVVSLKDNSVEHAMRTLDNMDADISKALNGVSSSSGVKPLALEERLRVLHSIYNQDGSGIFDNVIKEDGEHAFDLRLVYKEGLTSKDVIGPSAFSFKPNRFIMGNMLGCSMYLERIPNVMSSDFMADLSNLAYPMLVSINYTPVEHMKSVKMVRDKLLSLNAQIAERQKQAGLEGYSTEIISPELYRSQEETSQLLNELTSHDQKLYFVTMTVTVFAKSETLLEEAVQQISAVGTRHLAPIKKLLYQQEFGLNASLPLCINRLKLYKPMTTDSAAIFIPFTSQEIYQKNGVYYGINELTKSIIMYSRMSGRNFNGLIFGESGTGKSFTAKSEMVSVLLRSKKNKVYVIDPENEYAPLAGALGGEVITISSGSKRFVNPLDMDIDYGGDGDPVAMKADYVVSMMEIMLGRNAMIDPVQKSILDRCVKNIYRGYLQHLDEQNRRGANITCDKDAMPTLANLHAELLNQPEPEARSLAQVLEVYATGSMAVFSHRTNVETDSNFVVYDIKNIGTGMKDLGLHVCLNDIWNKMIENQKQGIWTWFYIDEFYLLLQSDSATRFLKEIWKRARKWNGVPTGIMQNTEDLFRTADARNIINNTSFVIMLSALQIDRDNLSELFGISDSQMDYITDAEPGHGLIYNGKTIIPFNNEYPKDTELYKVMSTSATKDNLQRENSTW